MTATESTSTGESATTRRVAELLETARRQYRAGHYGIALTALEQAAKDAPENETIELATAYLKTNMMALKARDAGMPVETPDAPAFFSEGEQDQDNQSAGQFDQPSTMELDADLPETQSPKPSGFGPGHSSSLELEALEPDGSDEPEDLPGFDVPDQERSEPRDQSSLELDALPSEHSEEIELEPFGQTDQDSDVAQADQQTDSSPSQPQQDSDDLFSDDDLALLADDEELVAPLATGGAPLEEQSSSEEDQTGDRTASGEFYDDIPTIARNPDAVTSPSAFGAAVAQASAKKSPALDLAHSEDSQVVFASGPSSAAPQPSSMTITGMPLPDFLKDQEDEEHPGQEPSVDRTTGEAQQSVDETSADHRASQSGQADSFDEAPTVAREHGPEPSGSFDEAPTVAREHGPGPTDAFDEAPTVAREHGPGPTDAFDEVPTVARDGVKSSAASFGDRVPTTMRDSQPALQTLDQDSGDWSVTAQQTPQHPGPEQGSPPPTSGEHSPLLDTEQETLTLGSSEMPAEVGMGEHATMERDTWKRKKDRNRPRPQDLLAEAKQLFLQGEHTRSLEICMRVLPVMEGDEDLEALILDNEEILANRYVVQLGGLDAIPVVTFDGQDLQALGMDHRKAFLLTRIDGELSIDDVLMISGMSRLETARTLMELQLAGLIRIEKLEEEDQ